MSCNKSKANSKPKAYTPKSNGKKMSSRVTFGSPFGSPKVRMSFAKRGG